MRARRAWRVRRWSLLDGALILLCLTAPLWIVALVSAWMAGWH